ncbi:hypothetical protein [Micromonospora kangleipakensis]|nr:hypothetical protein [Micromonospora kangleipakensis]
MMVGTRERMMVQLQLVSDDRHLVAWVRDDRRVRVGAEVSLRDHAEPDRFWRVVAKGEPRPAGEINRGWHNDI